MVGIYKITSPSGRIYIGQSWNIEKRHQDYRYLKCKNMPGLYGSFKKYTVSAHVFETIYELPADTCQLILDIFEIFYIEQFKEAGVSLLNVKDGGSKGKHSIESLEKLRAKRNKQVPPTLGKIYTDQARINMSIAQKKVDKTESKIRVLEKMHAARQGTKASEETKRKLRDAKAVYNHWNGKRHSPEARRKQSAAESIGVTMKHLSYRMSEKSPIKSYFKYV